MEWYPRGYRTLMKNYSSNSCHCRYDVILMDDYLDTAAPRMNSFIRKITFDKAALSLVTVTAGAVLGEAFLRTSLADAENAKQSRYPPLSKIITKEHIRELEKNNVVVINNILTPATLQYARDNVEILGEEMESSSNDDDVRQDRILSIRENDDHEHGDSLTHCIKLLRGIPFLLGKFNYTTSHSYVVPLQCQLARYHPDGSIYVRHLDRCNLSMHEMGLVGWLRASDYRYRVITAILYLNASDWSGGGELRLYNSKDDNINDEEEKHSDILPSGGKLILFDSSKVEHQVLASHGSEDRYALTCWFNGTLTDDN